MKKVIFLALFGCVILGSNAFAQTADDFGTPPLNPDVQGRGLVNTDVSDLNTKVSDLQRKVNDLERDQRFNQDRVRQLERDLSDIKRRF